MTTLAEEIVRELPRMMEAHAKGPRAADIARHMACGEPHARAAMLAIKEAGTATVVRYPGSTGRPARHLVPLAHDFGFRARACKMCDVLFEYAPKSKRMCCTRACGIAWSWTRPGVKERRRAGILEERKTPEAKARLAAHNKRRWSDPAQRKALSEQNRREWADPTKKAKRAARIQARNGSREGRKRASKIRKSFWDDPDGRQKMVDGIRKSKQTPEARAQFSELLRERWKDPEMRKKYTAKNHERSALLAKRRRADWADPEKRPALMERQRAAAAKAHATRRATLYGIAPQVLAFIRDSKSAVTAADIRQFLGVDHNPVRVALRALELRQLIVRRSLGDGKGSTPRIAWEAATPGRER